MCIYFLAISDKPKEDGYKIIIASNRDEHFNRPTKDAHFWHDEPQILSGRDEKSGQGNGTWLGITKKGKIGMLSNYRQHPSFRSKEARSRGELVVNYLKSSDKPNEYINKIKRSGKDYNGFNLIVGELSMDDDSSQFNYYCNQEHEPTQELQPGIYGLSNRYLDYGWKKILLGKERFQNIVKQQCQVDEKISLLFELLQDKTRYTVDDDFLGPCDKGIPMCLLEACTAISVSSPVAENGHSSYGTRISTVIVIDDENNVTFVEKSIESPINIEDIHWKTNTFQFKIQQ